MTASKRDTRTDWARAEAYENTPADYQGLPELDDGFFDRAKAEVDGKPIENRPPTGSGPKRQVTLRLDPEVIERFRASRGGWQARMNSFLASNQAVLEMIETYEDSILDLETLTEMFDRGELRAAHEGTGQAIARVKANIGITRKTVQTLREQLAWSKS